MKRDAVVRGNSGILASTRPTAAMTASNLISYAALCCGLTLAAQAAHAQLYTWKDTEGKVTIRNTPPPWYKESEKSRGPRVQVLRDNKVLDDTAWPLERRQEGRSQAAREAVAPPQAPEKKPRAAKEEDDD